MHGGSRGRVVVCTAKRDSVSVVSCCRLPFSCLSLSHRCSVQRSRGAEGQHAARSSGPPEGSMQLAAIQGSALGSADAEARPLRAHGCTAPGGTAYGGDCGGGDPRWWPRVHP